MILLNDQEVIPCRAKAVCEISHACWADLPITVTSHCPCCYEGQDGGHCTEHLEANDDSACTETQMCMDVPTPSDCSFG